MAIVHFVIPRIRDDKIVPLCGSTSEDAITSSKQDVTCQKCLDALARQAKIDFMRPDMCVCGGHRDYVMVARQYICLRCGDKVNLENTNFTGEKAIVIDE